MTTPQPNSTLDYADLPAGSRLIVRREGDGLIIEEPATGLVYEALDLLFGATIFVGFASIIVAYVWWRYMARMGITIAQIRNSILGSVPHWFADLDFVAVAVLILSMIVIFSRISRKTHVTSDHVIVERRLSLWREWTWPSKVLRNEIAQVDLRRFGKDLVLRAKDGKSLITLMSFRRADARWVARTLRAELNLEQS